jgi:uncharacterized protein YqjF (DUF2071 family)
MATPSNFLTAEWRKLAIANYSIDQGVLKPFLPRNTEIDMWQDKCYVSLVGFMFFNTKIKNIKVPFHSNFEEINLRFYVRHKKDGIWRRGVTFIKEIVPKPSLTFIANSIYKEKYETLPMNHNWQISGQSLEIEYKWKNKKWNSISVKAENIQKSIITGSEEEFITEHYWGYTKINDLHTSEYGVEHPIWNIYSVTGYNIDVDFESTYGKAFSFLSSLEPVSVMLAEGSEITVKSGRKLQ